MYILLYILTEDWTTRVANRWADPYSGFTKSFGDSLHKQLSRCPDHGGSLVGLKSYKKHPWPAVLED
jgi:hypothetical protein